MTTKHARAWRKLFCPIAAGLLVLGLGVVGMPAASAAGPNLVALTFDNGAATQYSLGYQQALQPHGAHATFYVNSGTVGVGTNIMTWAQLNDLAANGNDVGGKTINGAELTTDPNASADVCNDRAALVQHGLDPQTFAYPGGAFNPSVENIVQNCGYGNARSAGSLSPDGPTYAETLPPADWFATRAWAPGGQITFANLQALVNGAAANGGGLSQVVLGRVCSQAQDPANYSACVTTGGWIELADLNAFLDWMGNAGTGGAPAGSALTTVNSAIRSADSITPVTTVACNGSPCAGDAYTNTVYATLTGTDVGSGVQSTHYTLDGTDPSLASPTYSSRIPITSTTTIKFRSWDNAGNAEATNTQVIQATLSPDSTPPTTTTTCNGSACAPPYTGTVTVGFTATDGTGWGVDKTYYTTDGSTPTTASAVYTAPFAVRGSSTIRFFSTDLAGNSEPAQSQELQVLPYKTVVSLTYDDQYANFYTYLRPLLRSHNMNATFYVISSDSYAPYACCMSFAQLRTLQSEGDDVGGHGVEHMDLTDPNTTNAQKTADVCGNRTDLTSRGINDPASYAYPFGSFNANAESIVRSCGFQNSRAGGGLALTTNTPGLNGVYAETLPPADPYAVRTIDADAPNAKTLADMQNFVTAAEDHGGGWLPMTFHQVCHQGASDFSSCMSSWGPVQDTVMAQFLDWLGNAGQPGGAPAGVVVQTARAALNSPDATPPVTTAMCNGASCQTTPYASGVQVSLPATDVGGVGVRKTFYTTDGSTPTQSSTVYSVPLVLQATRTIKFFSVDNAGNAEAVQTVSVQVNSTDVTPPTTTIRCNNAACATWYRSGVQVTLSAADTGGSGVSGIFYTTDGSTPTTSSTRYTAAFTVAQASTVKFFATDNAGNAAAVKSQLIQFETTPPSTTILCNSAACASTYRSSVTVALAATDTGGSGVSATYYTTNGSAPTTSSARYVGPFAVTRTSTVRFFSADVAGNAEAAKSQLITVDTAAPTTTIQCNGAACVTGWYRASVTVSLAATDNAGGTGVSATYYTTDGSTPTTASAVYTGPVVVPQTSTVQYFSTDAAGNSEAVKSRAIRIDGAAPTVTITQPVNDSTIARGTAVTVTAAAADPGTGTGAASGIRNVAFYLDGLLVSTDASNPYTYRWSTLLVLGSRHTWTAVATDVAGNSTTSAPVIVNIG